MVRVNIKSSLIAVVIFLSSSRPQEREGGKGESGTSKTYFLLILEWMKLKKLEKIVLPPPFPPFSL